MSIIYMSYHFIKLSIYLLIITALYQTILIYNLWIVLHIKLYNILPQTKKKILKVYENIKILVIFYSQSREINSLQLINKYLV